MSEVQNPDVNDSKLLNLVHAPLQLILYDMGTSYDAYFEEPEIHRKRIGNLGFNILIPQKCKLCGHKTITQKCCQLFSTGFFCSELYLKKIIN